MSDLTEHSLSMDAGRKMKVFGIGLNKTGTKTLACCLQTLGFRHSSYSPLSLKLLTEVKSGCYESLYEHVNEYDSFDDWPYPLIFSQLDRKYPGSKFILTRRASAEQWFQSLASHSLRTDVKIGTRTRRLVYGFPYPQINPEKFLSFYQTHLGSVRNYFSERHSDMIEVCWDTDPSWHTLCDFLGRQPPQIDFPHKNSATNGDPERVKANHKNLRLHLSQKNHH